MERSKMLFMIFSIFLFVSISVHAYPRESSFYNLRLVREAIGDSENETNDESSNEDGDDVEKDEGHKNIYLTDKTTGEEVSKWNSSMAMNPEELGNYAQGDILEPASLLRNGLKRPTAKWLGGIIPYVIQGKFNRKQHDIIIQAMNDYHKQTCIKFVRRTSQRNYVRILSDKTGCWSSIGRVGGAQTVNLQIPGCVTRKGTVIHEFMHTVGFLHEQSREDRDKYVSIQWQNIQTKHKHNFNIAKQETTDDQGISYDYKSVMHYSAYAFSKNNKPTIVAKRKIEGGLGQRVGFSEKDAEKIRRMYKCSARRGGRSIII